MSFNIGNLHFNAPLPIVIVGVIAWCIILVLCLTALRRSVRPGRTGLLEFLRLLCGTVTVFFLLNPEWRRTIEPVKQPEIIIPGERDGEQGRVPARVNDVLPEQLLVLPLVVVVVPKKKPNSTLYLKPLEVLN